MSNRAKRYAVLGLIGIIALVWWRSWDARRKAVERVAEVEHLQWTAWSQNVAPEVSPERRARWKKYWIPYKDLPDDVKELDREWARKAIDAARAR